LAKDPKKTKPAPPPPPEESLIPSLGMLLVIYAVFVLFAWYLLYMYQPVAMYRLFSWLFNPFIS